MAALFIGALFMITGAIIHYARKNPGLEPTDRWIGAGLGTLKGVLASFALALIFQVIPEKVRERFPEIHEDSQSSWFIKGTASILESKALSITEHLAELREELKRGEFLRSAKPNTNPWHIDVSADRD